MYRLEGKIALVTGGSSGIGLNCVRQLLEKGVKGVAIIDIQQTEVCKELSTQHKDKVYFIKADLTSVEQIKSSFKRAVDHFSTIDIVINNAGIANEKDYEKTVAINLTAVIGGTKIAIEEFKKTDNKNGVVLNVASILGFRSFCLSPVYCATKHGVIGFVKSFKRLDYFSENNVRILAVCPGFTETPILSNLKVEKREFEECCFEEMQRPETVAETMIEMITTAKHCEIWAVENNKKFKVEWPTDFGEGNSF